MKLPYRIAILFAALTLLVVAATITVLPHADAARVTVFHVTPKNLAFNTTQGVNPPVQKITLSNSGKHTIYWRTMSAVSMQSVAIVPEGGKNSSWEEHDRNGRGQREEVGTRAVHSVALAQLVRQQ
jgi:hypothetical protein